MKLSAIFRTAALAGIVVVCGFESAAQIEPAKQKEADWLDARWNSTDIGNFHSSLLALPGGKVAKGLSVRLGGSGEGSVVYDTATATLRAAWTGGFVKFDGARYGLLNTPQPGGPIPFSVPSQP